MANWGADQPCIGTGLPCRQWLLVYACLLLCCIYVGLGLTGTVAGRSIAVGNRRLMAQVQEDGTSVLDSEAEWASKGIDAPLTRNP